MAGLEPATFCMASGSWVRVPGAQCRTAKRIQPLSWDAGTVRIHCVCWRFAGVWAAERDLCPFAEYARESMEWRRWWNRLTGQKPPQKPPTPEEDAAALRAEALKKHEEKRESDGIDPDRFTTKP